MNETTLFTTCGTVILTAYLFVTAPVPLPDDPSTAAGTVPVQVAFEVLSHENDVARTLYTREIVGAGTHVGLSFAEDWRRPGVDAGPLPALFLRATAAALERSRLRLGLFLGSDAPISTANRFSGPQQELFEILRLEQQPQFFYDDDTSRFTAMYPDVASAEACATCHNNHADSPRTDWRVGDVMGATTWTYPNDQVSLAELIEILASFRAATRSSYEDYLAKAASFQDPPSIGRRWPNEGRFLPDADTFMSEIERQSSVHSLRTLLDLTSASPSSSTTPTRVDA